MRAVRRRASRHRVPVLGRTSSPSPRERSVRLPSRGGSPERSSSRRHLREERDAHGFGVAPSQSPIGVWRELRPVAILEDDEPSVALEHLAEPSVALEPLEGFGGLDISPADADGRNLPPSADLLGSDGTRFGLATDPNLAATVIDELGRRCLDRGLLAGLHALAVAPCLTLLEQEVREPARRRDLAGVLRD